MSVIQLFETGFLTRLLLLKYFFHTIQHLDNNAKETKETIIFLKHFCLQFNLICFCLPLRIVSILIHCICSCKLIIIHLVSLQPVCSDYISWQQIFQQESNPGKSPIESKPVIVEATRRDHLGFFFGPNRRSRRSRISIKSEGCTDVLKPHIKMKSNDTQHSTTCPILVVGRWSTWGQLAWAEECTVQSQDVFWNGCEHENITSPDMGSYSTQSPLQFP